MDPDTDPYLWQTDSATKERPKNLRILRIRNTGLNTCIRILTVSTLWLSQQIIKLQTYRNTAVGLKTSYALYILLFWYRILFSFLLSNIISKPGSGSEPLSADLAGGGVEALLPECVEAHHLLLQGAGQAGRLTLQLPALAAHPSCNIRTVRYMIIGRNRYCNWNRESRVKKENGLMDFQCCWSKDLF